MIGKTRIGSSILYTGTLKENPTLDVDLRIFIVYAVTEIKKSLALAG